MADDGESPSQPDPSIKPDQREILLTIRNITVKRKRPPTVREVAAVLNGKSLGTLAYQYRLLETWGYLRRTPRCARSVQVRLPGEPPFAPEDGEPEQELAAIPGVHESPGVIGAGAAVPGAFGPDNVVWIPVAARVAAGEPILPSGTDDEHFPLPRQVVGEGTMFMLKVAGNSMIGAGIMDGDWVVVRSQRQAENGEIVAALVNGMEVAGTIKTLKLIDGHRWLMPQNPAHTPIPGDKADIYGKVVAVLRQV